ncbi:MAG: EF-P lysine aminoacylase EpmA [Pseudomonadota bacterium]|nr:EF-P lysine aminoacylase EpmA [Pseudomonadota bacterium]
MNQSESWKPISLKESIYQRAKFIQHIRSFFNKRQIMEVETPIINAFGVTEVHVENIPLSIGREKLWLRTSPEYHMKRLLAAGSGDIFQIGKCFRGRESGSKHQIEFTMVEWYRHEITFEEMYQECCQLIKELSNYSDKPIKKIKVHSYAESFKEHCHLDPMTADIKLLQSASKRFLDSVTMKRLCEHSGEDREFWLDLISSHLIHPALQPNEIHVITDYPSTQAMLSRLKPGENNVSERFEIFLNGLELANGFHELCDEKEQSRRFEEDRKKRRNLGLPDMAADPQLLDALKSGLPDCCGVALGLDRLIMAILNHKRIEKTLTFTPGG